MECVVYCHRILVLAPDSCVIDAFTNVSGS